MLAPVALLTGELYRTRELAPDASDPRWSPAGALLAYEIGGDSARRSVLLDANTASARPDTLAGYAAAFSPDGSELAYLSLERPAAVLRPLRGGDERTVDLPGLVGIAFVYPNASGPPYLVATADPSSQSAALYAIDSGPPRPLKGGEQLTGLPLRAAGGRLVFETAGGVTVLAPSGATTVHRGGSPVVSARREHPRLRRARGRGVAAAARRHRRRAAGAGPLRPADRRSGAQCQRFAGRLPVDAA